MKNKEIDLAERRKRGELAEIVEEGEKDMLGQNLK